MNDLNTIEVVIDYLNYKWSAIVVETDDEYEGTFLINRVTGAIHIEWYGIPSSQELWEDIEHGLREQISIYLR